MKIDFHKIQSQGNSYIYIDVREQPIPDSIISDLAVKVSDKSFGIGSDGLVLILPDDNNDAAMRIFNTDGSESTLCGSAVKAICFYLSRQTDFNRRTFSIKTGAGIVRTELSIKDDSYLVKADLSNLNKNAETEAELFYVKESVVIATFKGFPVFVGNNHFVIFDKIQERSLDLDSIVTSGPVIEKEAFFPDGANVEMVRIINRNKVEARVWERGSGETLACGSGALAIALAGAEQGYLDNMVEVVFTGGSKFVEIDKERGKYYLSGEVALICQGSYLYGKD